MTGVVKNFIETNYQLLNSNPNEFFLTAYNGLSIHQQGELIDILNQAGIEFEEARDAVLRYIIAMNFYGGIERPIFVQTYIRRYLSGILGYDDLELHQIILEESDELDVDIVFEDNYYKIYPRT